MATETDSAVTLREVTRETLDDVLRLEVTHEQRAFVASNAISIAQAHFYSEMAWFRAVHVGEAPVGFVMLEVDPAAGSHFLWRFMIDSRHQRKGLGQRAMALLFDHLRDNEKAAVLLTSVVPGDGGPGPFYEKLGFAYTGETVDGERVMRKEL